MRNYKYISLFLVLRFVPFVRNSFCRFKNFQHHWIALATGAPQQNLKPPTTKQLLVYSIPHRLDYLGLSLDFCNQTPHSVDDARDSLKQQPMQLKRTTRTSGENKATKHCFPTTPQLPILPMSALTTSKVWSGDLGSSALASGTSGHQNLPVYPQRLHWSASIDSPDAGLKFVSTLSRHISKDVEME